MIRERISMCSLSIVLFLRHFAFLLVIALLALFRRSAHNVLIVGTLDDLWGVDL